MFLVMKRPTAVRRKLLREKWLLSKGRYQGTGESAARSFSQITFTHEAQKKIIREIKEIRGDNIQPRIWCSLFTSNPACFRASRHFPVNLMSGRPSPISTSAYTHRIQFLNKLDKLRKKRKKKMNNEHRTILTLIFWCSWLLGSNASVMHHSYAAKYWPGFKTLKISL